MAGKRPVKKAAKYLRGRGIPSKVVRPETFSRAAEESGESFHDTLDTISSLLQAGSGLGPTPRTRRALARGHIRR